MRKFIESLIVQFKGFYNNLPPTQRMSIMLISVIVVAGVVVLSIQLSGQSFATLFSNIPSEQLPVIVAKLKEKNIPFDLRDGGKTVTVPKELLHSTQMAIMAETGSNRLGTLGLEIFDKQDFGATSYAQRINYQRALQGELVRAINTLDAVKVSKVILAIPPKKTFLEEGGNPSASVIIDLHVGKSLSPEQVKGVVYLVSSAVENLDPDRVTVVDSRGRVLNKNAVKGSAGISAEMLELKVQTEQMLEERIHSILEKVVGRGKVVARVDASLNPQDIVSVEETVDPDRTAIRAVTSEEEALNGSRTNPAGIPGARANLPGANDNGQVGFNQDVKKELKTTNFDVPKTVRNIKEPAGKVQRLSVAVLVDGLTTMKESKDGNIEETWNPRSADEIAKYESLVKNAVGFSTARGDAVKIENIRFEKEDFTESDKILSRMETQKFLFWLARWVVIGMCLGLVFFIVIRPFMRWVTDSFQESVDDMLPKTIEELEELQAVDNTLPGMSSALPMLEEALDPDKAESELLKEKILGLMTKDAGKAANALTLWLTRRDT